MSQSLCSRKMPHEMRWVAAVLRPSLVLAGLRENDAKIPGCLGNTQPTSRSQYRLACTRKDIFLFTEQIVENAAAGNTEGQKQG